MNKHHAEKLTVRDALEQAALVSGPAVFLLGEDGRTRTFSEVLIAAKNLAIRLNQAGLQSNERVAVFLDNGIEAVERLLALFYGGFVAVPINPSTGKNELVSFLRHAETAAVIASDESFEMLSSIFESEGLSITILSAGTFAENEAAGYEPYSAPSAESDALIVYTSGSTGDAKGVLLTQANLINGALNTISAHQLSDSDRSLCVLPISHLNAIVITILPTLISRGSLVFPRSFQPASFWRLIEHYACTWFAVVPTMINQLLELCCPAPNVESVRFARSSSAALPIAKHREFEARFGINLINCMGSTEAGSVVFANPLEPDKRKTNSVGLPQGFNVRIINEDGTDTQPGELGRICLRGKSIMKGYFKDPERTARVLAQDGWLLTNDLAYMDQDGYVFLAGRSEQLINKAGEKIYPSEIEQILVSHSSVLEAVCARVPDAFWGEDFEAFVILSSDNSVTKNELFSFIEERLGHVKTPRQIHFVCDFPRNAIGKPQRHVLAERAIVEREKSYGCNLSPLSFQTAETPIEIKVAEVWCRNLSIKQIGIYQNFFALGGHSLLVLKTISALRAAFEVELSTGWFFSHQTVFEQAASVAALLLEKLSPEEQRRVMSGDCQDDLLVTPELHAGQTLC